MTTRRKRRAKVRRETSETQIACNILVDGTGRSKINTGIPFLDHMLTLFAKHGLFDLSLKATGDLQVDIHHTNEDTGITLGQAFMKALGEKRGIRRYGFSSTPMDEALARISLDISGRPHLVLSKAKGVRVSSAGVYSFHDMEEFLKAFIQHAGVTLHIEILSGQDTHHIIESVFKALGRALDHATQIDPRVRGIPSTKGRI